MAQAAGGPRPAPARRDPRGAGARRVQAHVRRSLLLDRRQHVRRRPPGEPLRAPRREGPRRVAGAARRPPLRAHGGPADEGVRRLSRRAARRPRGSARLDGQGIGLLREPAAQGEEAAQEEGLRARAPALPGAGAPRRSRYLRTGVVFTGDFTGTGAMPARSPTTFTNSPVSYTHLRAHETRHDLVCRLLLEKK